MHDLLSLLKPQPKPHHLRTQNTEHSEFLNFESKIYNNVIRAYYANKGSSSKQFIIMICMQAAYGLRACEVLSIETTHILRTGHIRIMPRKRSNGRIIYFPEIFSLVDPMYNGPTTKVFTQSYDQYYRWLKKSGINFKIDKWRKNAVVTHFSRHHIFDILNEKFQPEFKELQNFSGHKSRSGLEFYLGRNAARPDKSGENN